MDTFNALLAIVGEFDLKLGRPRCSALEKEELRTDTLDGGRGAVSSSAVITVPEIFVSPPFRQADSSYEV